MRDERRIVDKYRKELGYYDFICDIEEIYFLDGLLTREKIYIIF